MLGSITLLLAAALVLVPLAKRLGLGSVLGYLVAGVLLGPFGFAVLPDWHQVEPIAEFGVVFLLFLIGLELDPQRLWALRRHVFGLGGAQLVLTGGAAFAIASYDYNVPFSTAAVIAFALPLSSTAFVLPTLGERGELTTRFGRSAFAILLFQDLVAIPVLALMPAFSGDATSMAAFGTGAAKALAAVGCVLLAGRYGARPLFRWITRSKNHELFTAAALFLVIGTAYLLEQAGLSMTLGAFLAGVVLANSEYRHELRANIEPFEGLLLGLFFLSVGVSANLRLFLHDPQPVLLLTATLLVGKAVILFALGRFAKLGTEGAMRLAFALPQGGEFAFVLLTAAARGKLIAPEIADRLVLAVTLSMVLSPLGFPLADRLARRLRRVEPEAEFDRIDEPGKPVLIAGFGRVGQIVARVLQASHVGYTVLDKSQAQVDFVRKFGSKLYFGDATRLELLRSAGAEDAKLFVIAVDSEEDALKIAHTVRKHFPHLALVARARNRNHAHLLMEAGVSFVLRETFGSSLELAQAALEGLGYETEKAVAAVARFREHDEKALNATFALRGDEAALIGAAKQYALQLETLFEEDRERFGAPPS